ITMRVAERATPVAAVLAALSTLACCLPFGFLGAMGLASLTVWAQSFRNWFIGGAAVLLVVGFVQLYRGRNQCKKRSPVSVGLLSVGWYLWGSKRAPYGQPPLTSLTPNNLDQFRSTFNDAADRARLMLLLSP